MSDTLIESFKHNGRAVEIHVDHDAGNPRKEFDNTAMFACWHRRYNLGDEQISACDEDEMRERIGDDLVMLLPLYLYDHSGLTISVGPFGCAFDSGQVGWAYVTKSALDRDGWSEEHRTPENLQALIKSEVEVYDVYLRGAVRGYVVKGMDDDETIDSCWGFYDTDDYVRGEAISAANAADDPAVTRIAEEMADRATYAAG